MSDRVGIQSKKTTSATSTPLTVIPPTRGFTPPTHAAQVQAKTQAPTQEVEPSSSKQETPDLQTQLDRASRYGHNFGRMQAKIQRPSAIQPKLTIGQPGDKYEQEADRVADEVMAMPVTATQPKIQRQTEDEEVQTKSSDSIPPSIQLQAEEEEQVQTKIDAIAPLIQRQEATQEEEIVQTKSIANSITPLIQRQPIAEEELVQTKVDSITPLIQQQDASQEDEQLQTKPLQLKAAPTDTTQDSPSLESRLAAQKGNGSPMSKEVRAFMEPRFGVDFSGVKIHTNSSAIQMNKELSAQAFTHGNDIYFGSGKYNPGTDGGKRLLAHELTHVVQQTGGVKLNKEVRRQPVQEKEDKQVLQAKEILGHSPEANLSKQLRLQLIDREEDKETLQAKELSNYAPESPEKELRLQPLDEEQEQSAQAKELSNRAPESPNKELRLQPQQEEEKAEPLQAKELPNLNPQLSFNKTLQRLPEEADRAVIQPKIIDGGFTPSPPAIQRFSLGDTLRSGGNALSSGWNTVRNAGGAVIDGGRALVSEGRDLLERGFDWVRNHIIQPLLRLAQSGWGAVSNFGSQISTAFRQANPTIWDVFQPQHLVFRTATNLRRQLFAQAIQAERDQRARAAANIQGSGPAPVQEPSQLERLDGLMTQVESVPAAGFDIGKQLLEGAVVGDFNENPTIWNTIGQVAIGFVPYAGQAADIRDITANVIQLHQSGYRSVDAWINLGLSCIGIIPGVGDIIKAVGRGSRGVIRSALSGVLRNGDRILRPVLGRAGGILRGARRYGSQFVGWASRQGARLRQSVTGFAQRAVNFARAAGPRVRSLVTAVRARVGQLFNGAVQRAQSITNQARGLLGRVMGQFMAMAQRAFSTVQSRLTQALSPVRRLVERGRELASRVAQKIAEVTRRAANLVREFTQSAIQKGRQALQTARQWTSQQIRRATELGRQLVRRARERVSSLISNGMRFVRQRVIGWIGQRIRGIKQRILGFLRDRWNRLQQRLGIRKPERGGETPNAAARKAKELPAAIAQAKAITEANDAADTPVPALLGVLNASVKSKYSWIKRFEARPKAVLGNYSIHMIASDYNLGDYTTKREGQQIEPKDREATEQATKQRYDDLCKRWENLSQAELEELQAIRQARGSNFEDVVPNTPEHKAQRWANYQGDWSYERWSQQYHTNMRNPIVGLAREQSYRELLGGENRVIQTSRGSRQVDVYLEAKREMYQIKTGKEDLTTVRHGGQLPNQEAIARDAELLQSGFKVYWVLEKGGSKQLLEALQNAGLEVKGAEFFEELQRLAQGG